MRKTTDQDIRDAVSFMYGAMAFTKDTKQAIDICSAWLVESHGIFPEKALKAAKYAALYVLNS